MEITITFWKFMVRKHLQRVYALSASALRSCKARPLITSLAFSAVSATATTAMDRGNSRMFRLKCVSGLSICGHPVECCVALTLMVTALATI